MFCWETLGAGIDVNATWHAPPIQTLLWKYTTSSQQHYPIAVATQQDSVPWHTANTAQAQLKEHNKGPKVLTGPQIPIWSSICKICWSRSDPWMLHPPTLKRPGARHHRTPSEVLGPCLDSSELFWLHKGNLHKIRQVAIMLCQIGGFRMF